MMRRSLKVQSGWRDAVALWATAVVFVLSACGGGGSDGGGQASGSSAPPDSLSAPKERSWSTPVLLVAAPPASSDPNESVSFTNEAAAVDDRGNVLIVWSVGRYRSSANATLDGTTEFWSRRFDASSAVWSAAQKLWTSSNGETLYPQSSRLVTDSSGNALLMWATLCPCEKKHLHAARFEVASKTWLPPITPQPVANDPQAQIDTYSWDMARVGNSDQLALAWNSDGRAAMAFYSLAQNQWSSRRVFDELRVPSSACPGASIQFINWAFNDAGDGVLLAACEGQSVTHYFEADRQRWTTSKPFSGEGSNLHVSPTGEVLSWLQQPEDPRIFVRVSRLPRAGTQWSAYTTALSRDAGSFVRYSQSFVPEKTGREPVFSWAEPDTLNGRINYHVGRLDASTGALASVQTVASYLTSSSDLNFGWGITTHANADGSLMAHIRHCSRDVANFGDVLRDCIWTQSIQTKHNASWPVPTSTPLFDGSSQGWVLASSRKGPQHAWFTYKDGATDSAQPYAAAGIYTSLYR